MPIIRATAVILIIPILLSLFFSCTSKKKMIYFQGGLDANATARSYSPVFCMDDLLSITVMGADPESVKPFNLPAAAVNNGNLGSYTSGTPSPPGYLVDVEGMIDFPVIGRIKIAGLDRMQANELLKEKLSAYVKAPTVNIRILNYKVTVLGEVKNPGTFTIPNERITLPEALGIAGDLTITGKRGNVLVIREVNGKRTETRIDLTSTELFTSSVYYLQQNDLVYVEPNRARINSSVINAPNVGIVISVISLLTTIAVLLSR